MAVSKYEFIKIEQRLFNDPRFYMLTEFEQLTYLKLVSLAKQTKNKIPKNFEAIGLYFRSNRGEIEVKSAVNRIKECFDNFNENKYFYYFEGWDYRYLKSECYPQQEKDKDKEEDKEEDKEKDKDISPKKQGAVDNSQKTPVFNEEEKNILTAVKNKTNIFALIEEFKKFHGAYPPKEILIRVCRQFLEKGSDITDPYPYLKASLHRAAQDQENLDWKKQGMAKSVKDILGVK